jgi:hypothetical protein
MGSSDVARYEFTVDGPLARGVDERIRARFQHVSTRSLDRTRLVVDNIDQAAVRAVMNLLWDAGHDILSISSTRPRQAD